MKEEMEFKFDPNQKHQLDAVTSVIDLFSGQEKAYKSISVLPNKSNELFTQGFKNTLSLSKDKVQKNLRKIQEKNHIHTKESIDSKGMNFSIEMETGTGKTYVYLRTIFELNQQYGFSKFIIVVPSIAIREGVLESIKSMKGHFKELYNNIPFTHFVYNPKKLNLLKNFPRDQHLQIMVLNIDAFNKEKNIMNQEREDGRYIEFIQQTNPIVIMDEPQNMESENAVNAIASLKPSFTLRYSATHRDRYNLLYRLDAVQALQKKLVKEISVISVVEDSDSTQAHVNVLDITNKNNNFRCKLEILKLSKNGSPKLSSGVFKQNDDLYLKSNENSIYKNGFIVTEINATPRGKFVRFSNGIKLSLGQLQGGNKEEIIKVQIKETIKAHFDKELQLKNQSAKVKVLSLFFLDRVSNYRVYNETTSSLGAYAKFFEEIYSETCKQYEKDLEITPVSEVHGAYFSKDKKGKLKDTSGKINDDTDTYNLIMKDKKKLLDINTPLKFIFSHSALREGWDNPNVFQICTLNETNSVLKKRQEIGRGMRLPVNQNGDRIKDEDINNLVVVANESYRNFADKLQRELEDEAGVTFGRLPVDAFVGMYYRKDNEDLVIEQKGSKEIWEYLKKNEVISDQGEILDKFPESVEDSTFSVPEDFKGIQSDIVRAIEAYQKERYIRRHIRKKAKLNEVAFLDPEFKRFWNRISRRTIYSVSYETPKLIQEASEAINKMKSTEPLKITTEKTSVQITGKGVRGNLLRTPIAYYTKREQNLPDILSYIQDRVQLTRKTIFEIIKKSKRLKDFSVNPQDFMDSAIKEIKAVLHETIIDGIKYEKFDEASYEMDRFKEEEQKKEFIGDKIIPTSKSIYDYIYYESGVEKKFAESLESLENIKYFIKLPNWFKVPTPVGDHNPDWAILKKNGDIVYMVRETKSTLDLRKLRPDEKDKIECSYRHFESIDTNYEVCTSIEDAKL